MSPDVGDAESVPPPGGGGDVSGTAVTAIPAPLPPVTGSPPSRHGDGGGGVDGGGGGGDGGGGNSAALAHVAVHPGTGAVPLPPGAAASAAAAESRAAAARAATAAAVAEAAAAAQPPPPSLQPGDTAVALDDGDPSRHHSQSVTPSSVASRSSGLASTTSTTDSELDLRVLSARAAEDFSISRTAAFLSRYHFIYVFLLCLCFVFYGSSAAALIISVSLLDLNIIATIVFASVLGAQLLSSLPMWATLLFWRACPPMEGTIGVDARGRLPSVDVVITVYKEDTDVIVGTLLAAQRLEYDASRLHIYLLDDGRRPELAEIVREMGASGALRHPLTYLTRESNAGAKGGNLNHWLRASAEVAGEFFITLDADMQPFPDALAILFGHYYGFDRATRERLAFVVRWAAWAGVGRGLRAGAVRSVDGVRYCMKMGRRTAYSPPRPCRLSWGTLAHMHWSEGCGRGALHRSGATSVCLLLSVAFMGGMAY